MTIMDILPATTITTTHHPDLSKSIHITQPAFHKNTLRQEHSDYFLSVGIFVWQVDY